jgi:glutamyl-Q tRNA(Asp) synthetase
MSQTGSQGGPRAEMTYVGRERDAPSGHQRRQVPSRYIGRFAPSPTGALHLGSLVAALGSFLDARKAGGRWLLRMEDLDTSRVIPGCSDEMLRTLEAFGLHWDGAVEFQSHRTALYAESLESLRAASRTFECSCSRRELADLGETGYPGTCRNAPDRCGPTATRFRVNDPEVVSWMDQVQGNCQYEIGTLGDPVIRRRDGVIAYQLAVVVDDAAQRVSDVIRGADLLESTAWQIQLQNALKLPTPRYGHLPLIMEESQGKLAKSRRSLAIDPTRAGDQLAAALGLLNHPPPAELQHSSPDSLLAWATSQWNLDRFQSVKKIVVSRPMSHV